VQPDPRERAKDLVTWEDLVEVGVAVPPYLVTTTLAEALTFCADMTGAHFCLKAVTQDHKARAGLVELHLATSAQLSDAWWRISARCVEHGIEPRLLVQLQVPAGLELIVGARRDPVFGAIVILGLGGRLAEHLDRSEIRFCPVGWTEALEMTKALLGETAPGVADIVVAASRIIEARAHLRELDLNPVILGSDRAVAVDLRFVAGDAPTYKSARPFAHAEIRRMISPHSVAVIGASNDPTKVGGRVLAYLVAHSPDLPTYPVNPRGGMTQGLPAVRSVEDLPMDIDVAVIAVDAMLVAGIIASCADRGITAAIVLSGGFSEAGNVEAEIQVREAAQRFGVRVCGVNTIGIVGDAPLTFTQAAGGEVVNGGVSYVTQSGALGGSLLLRSWAVGLGTSRYICVGNQTDLAMDDYLAFLAEDAATTTVGIFLEGITDGRHLREALHALRAAGKGAVVMRGGTSDVGQVAAHSHTGALAGSGKIYQELIEESGAISAADLPELVAMCQGLEWLPASAGKRVGIVSTSGGACSVLADFAERHGLLVPELEKAVQGRLREVLPGFAPTRNPVDTTGQVTADPHLCGRVAEIVVSSERIDALLVAVTTLTGQSAESIALDVTELHAHTSKPMVVAWSLPESVVGSAFSILRKARIPVFDSFGLSVSALSAAIGRPPAKPASQPMTQARMSPGRDATPDRNR
jgi:acyl-CoA synthetase (NDP forming)